MTLYRGDGGTPTSFGTGGRHYSTDSRTGLQRRGRLCDHAGLQKGGRLARPHRLTTPRPVHLSVPPQMLRSSLPSVSRGLVYINTPGRNCLHELLLSMSKSLLGKPSFSSNKIGGKLSCIISRRLHWMVQMGRRTSRRHYSLVNFKQPVGRDNWPSC